MMATSEKQKSQKKITSTHLKFPFYSAVLNEPPTGTQNVNRD
jgi:hypothetical protein